MNINAAFPSTYLKAADLLGKRVVVTIERVTMEDIGDESKKPVLRLQGKDKAVVLNKTNAAMLVEICGTEETERWRGISIVLYPTRVDYQGKRVDAIRIDYPQQTYQAAPPPAPVAPAPVATDEASGAVAYDDIPF